MHKINQRKAARLLASGLFITGVSLTPLSSAMAQQFAATAFSECPHDAFLTQGAQSRTFGIDLVTGDYKIEANKHRLFNGNKRAKNGRLNGLGFNYNDNFVYGWSYRHGQPARIHNDWTIEPLGNINITNNNFYVGDVSIPENRYYVYRRGHRYGLFYIDLDPASDTYHQMHQVVDGETMDLRIADIAFHPTTGAAYAVDRSGYLFKIDAANGTYENLGHTGQSGTFGAAYFDTYGNFYISRNKDGKIFRISLQFNDGFRCALAPITVGQDSHVDFGDAPDSYGTSLATNGARHGLPGQPQYENVFSTGVRLGWSVDSEGGAYSSPLSDNDQGHDENGIRFATSLIGNRVARVEVQAPEGGILSIWLDTDRNGVFDGNDQVVTDQVMNDGYNLVAFNVPAEVEPGETWARFRISSTAGLAATGGAPDGEVEDHQVKLLPEPATVSIYPSVGGYSTVAFEDNWPLVGDYDMNDLVAQLRTYTYETSLGLTRVEIEGRIAASGAFYRNGFGIRLPGVLRSAIDESSIEYEIAGRKIDTSPLEAGRNEAIFIIAENVFEHVLGGPGCAYYRTQPGCGAPMEFEFKLSAHLSTPQDVQISGVFDPFLFATPGEWHGAHFVSPPGRSYEVHLKNQAPTEAFDMSLFAGVGQDASDPATGQYFVTDTGMPWGLEIGSEWLYPERYD